MMYLFTNIIFVCCPKFVFQVILFLLLSCYVFFPPIRTYIYLTFAVFCIWTFFRDPFQLPPQANLRSVAAEFRKKLLNGNTSDHLLFLEIFKEWQVTRNNIKDFLLFWHFWHTIKLHNIFTHIFASRNLFSAFKVFRFLSNKLQPSLATFVCFKFFSCILLGVPVVHVVSLTFAAQTFHQAVVQKEKHPDADKIFNL